ncbi:MAG: hypothetical protein AAF399_19460 [Bacteroidota bacterium]
MKHGSFIFALALLFLVACTQTEQVLPEGMQQQIATIQSGTAELEDQNTLAQLFRTHFQAVQILEESMTAEERKIAWESIQPENFVINSWEEKGQTTYSLDAEADWEEVHLTLRLHLSQIGGGLYLPTETLGESCTGVNCQKCEFADGGGCDCTKKGNAMGPGYCNHSITKGGDE